MSIKNLKDLNLNRQKLFTDHKHVNRPLEDWNFRSLMMHLMMLSSTKLNKSTILSWYVAFFGRRNTF